MVDDRKLDVLRAIVEDYVATEEPVGSKALVERHGLGVSPATVRNDMAALEDEGYIHQPHTSAGRVPTDKGYRLFVDKLATLKPMSAAERRAIATLLDGAVDLDDVVQKSVRLLSQLTRQVAIVQYPTLSRSTVRHIELVSLTPTRVMLILILSTGRVEQRLVELDAPVVDSDLAELRVAVNQASVGVQIAAAAVALGDLPDGVRPEQADSHPRDRGRAHRGDVRPPQRRARRGRRHRQPRPLRRLRHRRPTTARGAGGARRAAQAAGGVGDRCADGAHRPRRPLLRARRRRASWPPATARRSSTSAPWASSAPPAWTTPDPWQPCARSRATSPGSSMKETSDTGPLRDPRRLA